MATVKSVKVLILAQGAYAAIESPGSNLDVLLPAGKGAMAGLMERAQEFRAKADRYARYADLCEEAAHIEFCKREKAEG